MIHLRPASSDSSLSLTRRRWLQVGLSGGAWLAARGTRGEPVAPGFGRAKACIVVYLFGGPSHLDIWDVKPEAPSGIRGEFAAIDTAVPGVRFCEHIPRLAARADRLLVVRSMTHGDGAHGSASHTMMTGRRPRALGEVGPTPDDFPTYGAVLARLRPPRGAVPPYVALPWKISTSTNVVPGQDGGFLGRALDPFRVAAPAATYDFDPPELTRDGSLDDGRLRSRRALRRAIEGGAADDVDVLRERAFDLFGNPRVAAAFQLDREEPRTRERYGLNAFGQSLLLARRLVEAGVPMITVYWPDRTEPEAFINNGVKDNVAVAAWDTHGHHVGATPNFPMLKERNLPPLDLGSAALLDDLAARGRLEETLVVWMGEFGRSPRINPDAGRDHYGNVFSLMMAGGGLRGGLVHGASDRIGAYPALDPVTPAQLAATFYHALGIDPATELRDPLGRPYRLAEAGAMVDWFA
jgi:hypothetical protein